MSDLPETGRTIGQMLPLQMRIEFMRRLSQPPARKYFMLRYQLAALLLWNYIYGTKTTT